LLEAKNNSNRTPPTIIDKKEKENNDDISPKILSTNGNGIGVHSDDENEDNKDNKKKSKKFLKLFPFNKGSKTKSKKRSFF